ncbi:MAG: FGGY-family carbohydrate kinase [Christensenellales bacterium]
MKYLIGTDIGTSGTKTIIMSVEGELIAQDLREYDVLTPMPLWAEQWPNVWLNAVKTSIKESVIKGGVDSKNIVGLCISGLYGGSGIPLDQNMEAVRPCIIWMDRRATEQEKWVREHIGEDKVRQITKNGIDPYYGYLKILWIKDNEPENWEKVKMFLPPNAYVIYKLTGEIAIDYSSAGNLGGIFDMSTRYWSFDLMDSMGIPRSMMPERIVQSMDIVGMVTKEAADELGLIEGTPVCAGGVDCGVATFGAGVYEPGEYVAAIGTSMCAALINDKPIKTQNLIEWPYVIHPKELTYSFGGSSTAGALIKWFRDNFAQKEKDEEIKDGGNAYAKLDKQAEQIPAGADGIIVLPYFMGERSPLWDTNAKGVIFGLSLVHTRAHIYRAFLEAVAYSLRHTIESTGIELKEHIIVVGGASRSKLWRQIIADVTGYSVICPLNDVEANLGDVMLAGLGTGYLSLSQIRKWNVMDKKVEPNKDANKIYNEYYKLYHKLYADLQKNMEVMTELKNSYQNYQRSAKEN